MNAPTTQLALAVGIQADSYAKGALLSPDRIYRYSLWRKWDADLQPLHFIMLNPSTADAEVDDPTIRRCMGFARREGYGGIRVLNLYALRATDPRQLREYAGDPVGPNNDIHLLNFAINAAVDGDPIVAAWGTNASPVRVAEVLQILHAVADLRILSLGTTIHGHPRHPLYVPADHPFTPWPAA
jgi:hypothetical protein